MKRHRPRTITVNRDQSGDGFLREYWEKTRRLSPMEKLVTVTMTLTVSLASFATALVQTQKRLEEFGRAATIAWHKAGKAGYR